MVEAIVFDLDDTLYLERDYVASGFRMVANLFRAESAMVFKWLWSDFCTGERSRALERVLIEFPMGELSADLLVDTFRSHDPTINTLPGAHALLGRLRSSGRRLGMITDGDCVRQMKKVTALGLSTAVDEVLVTGQLGSDYWKPHERSFEMMQTLLTADSFTYVGDNPHKDFVAPNALGWTSIRLELDGQLHAGVRATDPASQPSVVVSSLAELATFLCGNESSEPC